MWNVQVQRFPHTQSQGSWLTCPDGWQSAFELLDSLILALDATVEDFGMYKYQHVGDTYLVCGQTLHYSISFLKKQLQRATICNLKDTIYNLNVRAGVWAGYLQSKSESWYLDWTRGWRSLECTNAFFFSFTLVTGPRRFLSLKMSDARVYEP